MWNRPRNGYWRRSEEDGSLERITATDSNAPPVSIDDDHQLHDKLISVTADFVVVLTHSFSFNDVLFCWNLRGKLLLHFNPRLQLTQPSYSGKIR